jgi:hypothetical protein
MFVRTALEWSRWVHRTAGALGVAGLVLAAVATVNLGVPRTCATQASGGGPVLKETNRPVISVVLGGDDCYAEALGQFEIVGVIVVGVSALAVRRSSLSGSAPSLVAPPA